MAHRCANGLALLRVGLGLTFIQGAIGLIMSGYPGTTDPLLSFFQKYTDSGFPGYDRFLQDGVVPHAGLFAYLVLLGELFVGISLTFGLLTRAGALVSAFLALNFALTKGPVTVDATDDRLVFLSAIVLAVTTAEIAWSLDRRWRPLLDANPLTRWLSGPPAPARGGVVRVEPIRTRESRAA